MARPVVEVDGNARAAMNLVDLTLPLSATKVDYNIIVLSASCTRRSPLLPYASTLCSRHLHLSSLSIINVACIQLEANITARGPRAHCSEAG